MADTKISALSAETAAPGDEIPVNRGGVNYKITAGDILKQDSGTLTASAPALDLTQTWNNSGVTFTGMKFNAISTDSASGSLLMDLQVGGASKASVTKSGKILATNISTTSPGLSFLSRPATGLSIDDTLGGSDAYLHQVVNGTIVTAARGNIGFQIVVGNLAFGSAVGAPDLVLARDTANTLAQRRTSAGGTDYPQTFRIYNKYTDASNYERGFVRWNSDTLEIGSEKGGSGTLRSVSIMYGATNRAIVFTSGEAYIYTKLRPASSNVYDLGASAQPWKDVYVGTSIIMSDSANIAANTTTGTKIGTATSQKLAFWNATPVVQPTTGISAGAFVANTSGITDDSATFDGYTIGQVVAALRQIGVLA